MVPKRRRFAVLLGSLLFAASILSVPALATEEGGFVPYTENGDNGAIVFPTNPAPPTPTPEPTPTPTPVPTPEPTPVPTPEPTPVVDPTPSEDPDDDPPYVPDNPTPRPSTGPNNGGTVTTPAPTPHPSNRPVPTEQPVIQRPVVTPKPDGPVVSSPEIIDDGTNYVTFAQLNVKNNSLAIALFYGGLACAVLGTAGLIFFLVRFLQKRRRDEKAAIFREIEAAENRQHTNRVPSGTPELMVSPNHGHPTPHPSQSREHSPHPQTPAPRQHSAAPAAQHPSSPHPTSLEEEHPFSATRRNTPHVPAASSTRPQTGPNAPLVPMQASMYTEEFSLTAEEPAAPPKPQMASRLRQSAQHPAEKQAGLEKKASTKEKAEAPKQEAPKQEAPKKPKAEKETEPSDAQIPGQMSLLD